MYTRRKIVALLLIMLIAAGCGKTGAENETGDTSSGGTSSFSSTQSEQSTLQTSWDTPKPEDIIYPSTPEKDLIIIPDYQINETSIVTAISFPQTQIDVITAEEIRDISLSVSNADVDCGVIFGLEEREKFPYYLFQCYQNVDWALMYSLYQKHGSTPSTTFKPYEDYYNLYDSYYKQFDTDSLPVLYHYRVFLSFNSYKIDLTEDIEINGITLTINGREFKMDNWRFYLDYETKFKLPEGLYITAGGISGGTLFPNDEGYVPSDNVSLFHFTCEKDIKITNFYMKNDGVTSDISITSESNGAKMNQKWTGEPMSFSKGTTLDIFLSYIDESYAGKLYHSLRLYPLMEYECGGDEFIFTSELSKSSYFNAYEIYAAEVDGVDLYPYYAKYFSLIRR